MNSSLEIKITGKTHILQGPIDPVVFVKNPSEMPVVTPQKINIATEKWWLEDYFPIGKAYFQGLC